MAARNDELGGRFVLAGPLALGREAPGRHRVTAAARASAERMIDRIHRLAANVTVPAERAIWPPFPIFISMLCTMVPIGMLLMGMALPGFTSTRSPETTVSPGP